MTPKNKRGPKPKGLPRRTVIAFGVSEEEKVWLTALPNRSEWLRERIAEARKAESVQESVRDTPQRS